MNTTTSRCKLALAIAVLLFGAALASGPLESLHGHDRLAPCAICQLAHLPALQPAIIAVIAFLEPVTADVGPGARAVVSEAAVANAIPRAPPILHSI